MRKAALATTLIFVHSLNLFARACATEGEATDVSLRSLGLPLVVNCSLSRPTLPFAGALNGTDCNTAALIVAVT